MFKNFTVCQWLEQPSLDGPVFARLDIYELYMSTRLLMTYDLRATERKTVNFLETYWYFGSNCLNKADFQKRSWPTISLFLTYLDENLSKFLQMHCWKYLKKFFLFLILCPFIWVRTQKVSQGRKNTLSIIPKCQCS